MASSRRRLDIYGGRNPVDIPAYALAEAAHNLQLTQATVHSWVLGRNYPTGAGVQRFEPLIRIIDPVAHLLSFRNLVELHVLSAIRRDHQIRLQAVRNAIGYLRKNFHTDHPLAEQQMLTDGRDLFIERYGELVNVSAHGQMAMKKVLEAYLARIERDPAGVPIRLFPFTSSRIENSPSSVAIDPQVQFGRPCLTGSGIPTAIVAERYKAGDSIQVLAEDYGRSSSEIEEAIRYEHSGAA